MRLVILEVLSNPLLWGWEHGGDLTADFAPVVRNLTPRFVKSPVFPHPPPGVGHEIDKCITMTVTTLNKITLLSNILASASANSLGEVGHHLSQLLGWLTLARTKHSGTHRFSCLTRLVLIDAMDTITRAARVPNK